MNSTAKLQMQTIGPKLYTGPIDCARQVVRAGGLPGLWHGFGATLAFRTGIGALYGTYEMMLRGFRAVPAESPYKLSNEAATFISGASFTLAQEDASNH
jgi:solute carrier family 25 carnitine/acylcarnitine transporter 20/29